MQTEFDHSYYDSAKGEMISKARAYIEIVRNHNLTDQDFEMFLRDEGDRKTYDAQSVLIWLGY